MMNTDGWDSTSLAELQHTGTKKSMSLAIRMAFRNVMKCGNCKMSPKQWQQASKDKQMSDSVDETCLFEVRALVGFDESIQPATFAKMMRSCPDPSEWPTCLYYDHRNCGTGKLLKERGCTTLGAIFKCWNCDYEGYVIFYSYDLFKSKLHKETRSRLELLQATNKAHGIGFGFDTSDKKGLPSWGA